MLLWNEAFTFAPAAVEIPAIERYLFSEHTPPFTPITTYHHDYALFILNIFASISSISHTDIKW